MAQVTARDLDYMRRLGEFMAEVHADELAEHRRLTVTGRLLRSERLSKRDGGRDASRAQQTTLPPSSAGPESLGSATKDSDAGAFARELAVLVENARIAAALIGGRVSKPSTR